MNHDSVDVVSVYNNKLYYYRNSMFTGGSSMHSVDLNTGKVKKCAKTQFTLEYASGSGRYIYGEAYLNNEFKTVAYDCKTDKTNKISGNVQTLTTFNGKLYYAVEVKDGSDYCSEVYKTKLSGKGTGELVAHLHAERVDAITREGVYYQDFDDDTLESIYYFYTFGQKTGEEVSWEEYNAR